jgi:hypothetical protein
MKLVWYVHVNTKQACSGAENGPTFFSPARPVPTRPGLGPAR